MLACICYVIPAQVGLGHELGHAKKGIDGKADRETDLYDDKQVKNDLNNGSLLIN